VGGCDERVHAVRLKDGVAVTNLASGSYVAASPAVRDGLAYVGHYQGEVLALDLAKGLIRWRFAADGAPAFFASVAVTSTRVLAASRAGVVYCLSRDTGREIWRFQAQDEIDSSPVVARDRVLFGSRDGRLTMLRYDTGELLWSYLVGSPITAAVAVVDGWIVVGAADGVLYAFGEEKKKGGTK
jgi:outer membrane protein assembly factor BamB